MHQVLSVIIPTYDERENIVALVDGVLALPTAFQLFVVDDNSPDGTGQLADDLAGMHSSVHVLLRPGKLGLGTAHEILKALQTVTRLGWRRLRA